MAVTGKDELKRAVCDAIDRHGDEIIELGETILHHPETGFNEVKTAALIAERMRALGLEPQIGLAVTGVKGRLKGKMPGPRLAFIGELDSLRTSDHPLANPQTGAAHSCGHNAQVAGVLGVAMGLSEIGASDHLAGDLVFLAVPAKNSSMSRSGCTGRSAARSNSCSASPSWSPKATSTTSTWQ
jgi:metal-dependent amidase/aminoacylase/carboxypeptidase family protein